MDIIEALKANEKPFGLMSEEMQDKAKEIGKNGKDIEYYSGFKGGWALPTGGCFVERDVYRLRPDYEEEEEPEVEKCKVEPGSSAKGLNKLVYLGSDLFEYLLSEALNDPDFIGYMYDDVIVSANPRRYMEGGITSFLINEDELSRTEVIIPTYVLFRKVR